MIFPFTQRLKPVILLVDDNYFIKKLLTKILEAKYTVYTAADGLEALLLLHQRVKPDLIITDIEMPRMNGYEFINAIQKNGLYKQIPVCILSDNHVNVIKNELGNMKVAEIFTKPFDPYNLMDKLNSALTKLQKQYHITS
jgi:CheY-like chemotaxis protein